METAVSHCAKTADSVGGASYDSFLSVSTVYNEPIDDQIPIHRLQYIDNCFHDNNVANEHAQQELAMPLNVEALQVRAVLMRSDSASRASSRCTKYTNLPTDQGYVLYAQHCDTPVLRFEKVKTGGSVQGPRAKAETDLDLRLGMRPLGRQLNTTKHG